MSDVIPQIHMQQQQPHAPQQWEHEHDYSQLMMARKVSGALFPQLPLGGGALPLWPAHTDANGMHMQQQQTHVVVQHEAPQLFAPIPPASTAAPVAFGFDAPAPVGDPMTPSGRASSSSRTNSRSSSPFSASAPLDSPLGAWEEPAAEEGTSSEGESAASLHSASRPAQAHQTLLHAPFDNMHMHTPQQQAQQHTQMQMQQSSAPVPRPFNALPPLDHSQFAHSQAAAHQQYQQQMSLMQSMLHQQMVMPPMNTQQPAFHGDELHAGPPSGAQPSPSQPFHVSSQIGMLQPTHNGLMSLLDPINNGQEVTSGPSSVVGSSTASTPNVGTGERLQVRAKRRTRYSAAAATPTRSTPSFQHSSSVESRKNEPTDNDGGQQSQQQQRSSSSQQQSQESCGSGSASGQSSENEEQQQASASEEEEEQYTAKTPSKSTATKRKRASTSKASSQAAAAAAAEEPTPNMKGLDKRERNKLSASQYRKRRKVYLDSLEGKVGELDHTIAKQGEAISKMAAENRSLKEQLSFFKKLVGHINPALLKADNNQNQNQNHHPQQQQQQQYQQQAHPAAAQQQQQQPSNMHHTGSRGARHMGGSAMGFMMIVVACLMLCNPAAFLDFGGEVESGAASSTPSASAFGGEFIGRRGRTLLSVVDEPSVFMQPDSLHDFTGMGYASEGDFASLSNETDDAATTAALLDGLSLADAVPVCAKHSWIDQPSHI